MKTILIVLALCVPAFAEEVETGYSRRIFADRGRETDVTELRSPQSAETKSDSTLSLAAMTPFEATDSG